MTEPGRRGVVSWAMYDFANSTFVTTVVAVFFPLFFRRFWAAGAEDAEITFRLGLGNTLAALCVALLAPILGAIADHGGARKRFLAGLALPGAAITAALALAGQGQWTLALTLYGLAWIGWAGANTFYDSLLVSVADESRFDRVSAFGFSMGYLGGGLLLVLNALMYAKPGWFGLAGPEAAVRFSLLSVGVWWAVFTIPLLLHVPEPAVRGAVRTGSAVRAGFARLRATFGEIRRLKVVGIFLAAYWLYIDGVGTMVKMAFDHGLSLGIGESHLVGALLMTQFVSFPCAILFGRLAGRIGIKRTLLIGLAVYVGVCAWGAFLDRSWEFWVMAGAIGFVQGGVAALSRSLYARIVPPSRSAEFFGFYNMVGRYAAIVGPVLLGAVKLATGSASIAIVSIAALFLAGGLLLTRVDVEEGRRAAAALDAQNPEHRQ